MVSHTVKTPKTISTDKEQLFPPYTSETALVGQILGYFKYSDTVVLDRHPSGKVMISKGGRLYWMNLARKGTPDITGFVVETGQHIGIECKIKKNKLSEEQAEHARKLRKSKNGIYILARSLDDVLDVLEPREPLPF